ncbi:MAG TPA: hypothetical protein VIA06_06370 [Candidatus Dormibacteraeota bacterium]|jgi:hypothetical protein|nr:hypothetical protein [Candidatus Dormibacteraeota bacterium]
MPSSTGDARLAHVRWIGGGSGAGKSTVARRLADTHGLRVYSCDATISEHGRRSDPTRHPLLHSFMAMDMDQRWVTRPPEVMERTFPWFRGEAFEMIVDDLLRLPLDPPVLVEGFRLLPRLVAPLVGRQPRAVWLLPTPDFRISAFDRRGFTWEIPGRTGDPPRALANLLDRDRLFTDQVAEEAAALGLPVVHVDGELGVEALTERTAKLLGLTTRAGDRPGPRSTSSPA